MWIENRQRLTHWRGGLVEPAEVLYDFDGPAIFTVYVGPAVFLFFKVAEQENEVFLAAPIDEDELAGLKGGSLSIRGAISHREAWLVEADIDYRVVQYQEQTYNEFKHFLPVRGLALYSRYGEVPDSIEQAEAFLSFKFESDLMSSESMPLSVLKSRVDAVSDLVRNALLPNRLASGRKAKLFDLEVAPLQFASLLIAIKEPQIDALGLLNSKETAAFTAESLLSESEDRGAQFLEELDEAAKLAKSNPLTHKEADTYFELLDQIASIIPSGQNDLTRLQVGFRTKTGTKLVSIDKKTGDRMLAARRSIEAPIRSIVGAIIEINDDAKTFIVKDAGGRQTTVNPLGHRYEEMQARKINRIGQRVKVTGKLWERVRRDYMILTAEPISLTSDDSVIPYLDALRDTN